MGSFPIRVPVIVTGNTLQYILSGFQLFHINLTFNHFQIFKRKIFHTVDNAAHRSIRQPVPLISHILLRSRLCRKKFRIPDITVYPAVFLYRRVLQNIFYHTFRNGFLNAGIPVVKTTRKSLSKNLERYLSISKPMLNV